MGKQLTVEGQLGDKAMVEVGRGSLYIGGKGSDNEHISSVMLSPDQARRFAGAILEAADYHDAQLAVSSDCVPR